MSHDYERGVVRRAIRTINSGLTPRSDPSVSRETSDDHIDTRPEILKGFKADPRPRLSLSRSSFNHLHGFHEL